MRASAHNISDDSRHVEIMAYSEVGNYDPTQRIAGDGPWGAECETPITLCDDNALIAA